MTDATLKERVQSDLITARKARDAARTLLLSTTLSELKNAEIDNRGGIGEEDMVQVVSRAIKRRKEAADQMRETRPELAAKEEQEAEWLQAYLPAQLEEAAVREMVREALAAGASDLGSVMGAVMPKLKGRFDGKAANRIVREELGS